MFWRKLGLVFCANKNSNLMITGGRAPVPYFINNDTFRIYFASYDEQSRGRVFSLEIDINHPQKVKNLNTNPIIDIGNIGFYNDNGIIPSWITSVQSKLYLYTIGFSIKNKLIFDAASGLATSIDGGQNFEIYKGPVIDRSIYDPCFAASPCVIFEEGEFKMWYVSCERWEKTQNGFKHYYNIKSKVSSDGIHWSIKSSIAIDFKNQYEYAISRPSVIREKDGIYKMWYSFRAQPTINTYRIGYAESPDGINWVRKDEEMKSFDVSHDGWDSEMVCYPYVFDHKGKRYMLYNGNHYGKSGFGLAILENI